MTTNYTRGAQCERALIAKFEAMGYWCLRSAGSHTPIDILAWDGVHFRFIQVKRGYLAPKELEDTLIIMAEIPKPLGSQTELWQWVVKGRRGTWWRHWLQAGICKSAEAP